MLGTLIKLQFLLMLSGSFLCFFLSRNTRQSINEVNTNKDKDLINLTKNRRKNPLVFLSYTGRNVDTANKCSDILSSNGFKVKKYNPDELWMDPAGEVIESIETSNALIYVSGGLNKTNWIIGEITYSNKYNIPFIEFEDNIELKLHLNEIHNVSKEIDLIKRLRDITSGERLTNVLNAFEKYIDEDIHGSEWVSDLNMEVKTGNDTMQPMAELFLFVLGCIFLILSCITGIIWAIFYR